MDYTNNQGKIMEVNHCKTRITMRQQGERVFEDTLMTQQQQKKHKEQKKLRAKT